MQLLSLTKPNCITGDSSSANIEVITLSKPNCIKRDSGSADVQLT